MSQKHPPIHPRLDNESHEQFARCISAGNFPIVCHIGVGYNGEEAAANALANSKSIRLRAEEIFRQKEPTQYSTHGYTHITDKMNGKTR